MNDFKVIELFESYKHEYFKDIISEEKFIAQVNKLSSFYLDICPIIGDKIKLEGVKAISNKRINKEKLYIDIGQLRNINDPEN